MFDISKKRERFKWMKSMKKEKKEKKKKEPPTCPPDCQCRCHKEKSVTEVAIDMALLTANANQLRILMVMKDLCEKIKWEQTRTLETGQVVTTGCEVKLLTWKILLYLVMLSLGLQIFVGLANAAAFAFIKAPNQSVFARIVNTFSTTSMFLITATNIILTGIFSS